jgi:putative ABC transport system permease protein
VGRRLAIESFGLTSRDLARIAALPDVTAIPVRHFPAEARRLHQMVNAVVVGTVAGYENAAGIHLAEGRFLDDEDDQRYRNVAVLGAEVAERLFPEDGAIGKVVRVGGFAFQVVGILREQDRPAGGMSADEVNRGVFLPLRTCRARLGETVTIRRAGAITREKVELNEILVQTSSPEHAGFTGECVEAILEELHPRQDWAVRVAR